MTNCFSLRDYVIKTFRRRPVMQIFTEIIFEECPWPTKRRRSDISPNSEKIRGQLLCVALFTLHAKPYCMSAIPRNSTITHS